MWVYSRQQKAHVSGEVKKTTNPRHGQEAEKKRFCHMVPRGKGNHFLPDTQTDFEALRSLLLCRLTGQCQPPKNSPSIPSTNVQPFKLLKTAFTAPTHHNLLGHRSRSAGRQVAAWDKRELSLLSYPPSLPHKLRASPVSWARESRAPAAPNTRNVPHTPPNPATTGGNDRIPSAGA